ncbi:unnamed protein product [Polarella glacialis]|uniref:Secreted protein n=1 Tax=Polarella glacialis TaxID=89957 RepID=A0A813DG20_POLGL|nr:unnamed protein product [Polarella glacialis]
MWLHLSKAALWPVLISSKARLTTLSCIRDASGEPKTIAGTFSALSSGCGFQWHRGGKLQIEGFLLGERLWRVTGLVPNAECILKRISSWRNCYKQCKITS